MTIKEFWARAKIHSLFLVGSVLVLFMVVLGVLADVIAPYAPYEQHLSDRLQPPSTDYLLGTDWAGRDTFSRLIYGSRITLNISFSTVLLAGLGGISLGLLAGYFGGLLDTAVSALTNLVFSFPSLILALTISVLLGPSTLNLIFVLSILYAPNMIRMTRSAALATREQDFVTCAHAVGCSTFRVLTRHILPNLIAPVLVQLTLGFSWCILSEAALTFLGFGAQPPDASWGSILNEGRPTIWVSAWPSIFAGVFIAIAVLGFNFVGDGLRDILDPTQRFE